jgi:Tol biopolymer transport system component
MNATGRGVRELRTGLPTSFAPAWSPNGKEIAFAGSGS